MSILPRTEEDNMNDNASLDAGTLRQWMLGTFGAQVVLTALYQMTLSMSMLTVETGFNWVTIFSRVHATLQPALSVCRSVGRSVGRSRLAFFVILRHFKSF